MFFFWTSKLLFRIPNHGKDIKRNTIQSPSNYIFLFWRVYHTYFLCSKIYWNPHEEANTMKLNIKIHFIFFSNNIGLQPRGLRTCSWMRLFFQFLSFTMNCTPTTIHIKLIYEIVYNNNYFSIMQQLDTCATISIVCAFQSIMIMFFIYRYRFPCFSTSCLCLCINCSMIKNNNLYLNSFVLKIHLNIKIHFSTLLIYSKCSTITINIIPKMAPYSTVLILSLFYFGFCFNITNLMLLAKHERKINCFLVTFIFGRRMCIKDYEKLQHNSSIEK